MTIKEHEMDNKMEAAGVMYGDATVHDPEQDYIIVSGLVLNKKEIILFVLTQWVTCGG